MNPLPQAVGEYVIIRPIPATDMTSESGIIMPSATGQSNANRGTVLSCGKEVTEIEPGIEVFYTARFDQVFIDKAPVHITKKREIIARV